MFRDDADRQIYLGLLSEGLAASTCELHAYVLMTNHVHLLATGHQEGELSVLMRRVGGKFARLMNMRWGRTGTLFEGRFRSSLIESEAYLLTCMVYIELNPVRAGMVASPGDFPWSSYGQNSSGSPRLPLVPQEVYDALGITAHARGSAYRELVGAGISEEDLASIRTSLQKSRALGREKFVPTSRCNSIGTSPPAPREGQEKGTERKMHLSPFWVSPAAAGSPPWRDPPASPAGPTRRPPGSARRRRRPRFRRWGGGSR
jgi:putative transposase